MRPACSWLYPLLALGVPLPALAADASLARNLAATCANCHGTDGFAQTNTPLRTLAGQDAAVLRQKLAAFRNGSEPATVMHQIARGYTPQQLDLIATFLAQQKREATAP